MDTLSARELIEKGEWATCWICEEVFRRRIETKRYCATCGRGFCEGQHGSFAQRQGKCIICGVRERDKR